MNCVRLHTFLLLIGVLSPRKEHLDLHVREVALLEVLPDLLVGDDAVGLGKLQGVGDVDVLVAVADLKIKCIRLIEGKLCSLSVCK